MRKPINVIPITVANGTTGNYASLTLDEGTIKGISIYKNGVNNTGFVRAAVRDTSGNEIVPFHHIDNYRNRECAYNDGFMPVRIDGGRKITVEINSDQQFTDDTLFEAVFFYEKAEDC